MRPLPNVFGTGLQLGGGAVNREFRWRSLDGWLSSVIVRDPSARIRQLLVYGSGSLGGILNYILVVNGDRGNFSRIEDGTLVHSSRGDRHQ